MFNFFNSPPYPKQLDQVVAVVETDDGKAVLMKNSQYVPPNHVCQTCGNILVATDLLDYICNSCEGK